MRAHVLLLIASAVVMPSPAFAEDWVMVGVDANQSRKIYIDRSSIRRSGAMVRYWTKAEYNNHPDGWAKDHTLEEANCSTSQTHILQIGVVFTNGRSVLENRPGEWVYVTPGSLADATFKFACNGVK